MWRGRTASDVWVEKMLDLVKLWSPMSWAEETGQIRSGVGPLIDKRSRERRVYVHRQAFPTKYDKAVRDYSEAIRLNPNFAMAYKNRGDAYKIQGELDKAKADFAKAEELGRAGG